VKGNDESEIGKNGFHKPFLSKRKHIFTHRKDDAACMGEYKQGQGTLAFGVFCMMPPAWGI